MSFPVVSSHIVLKFRSTLKNHGISWWNWGSKLPTNQMSGGVLGKNQKDISSAKEWPLKKWPPTLARVGGHGQRSHGLQSSTLRRVGDDWSTLVSHIPYWYQWYLDVISHLTSLCVMRLEIWCRKLKEESSNFAHTAVLWDAIAPQSSFQTKVWSESSFCHALRCWYKLEIEIGLISSLNRVRGGIPSLLFAFHVLMTSKSEFCSQVACANLLNRRHDWKGTEKLLLDLLAIKKKMFFNVARVFRWLNHFCCHQFSRFNLFPWTRKMAKPNSQQQVGASMGVAPYMWFRKRAVPGITAHQISTCSCGRSPSLHDRRKGNRSTSCQRAQEIAGSAHNHNGSTGKGAEKCSSSRNTDLKQVQNR